jgi:RHS repeat-associated protein
MTDEQGNLVWRANYRAWGEARITKEAVKNPIRFQGQYFDHETGLHYNRHRYYDPQIGRFISKDPIGLMGGLNPYAYAPNPVRWVDPRGLQEALLLTCPAGGPVNPVCTGSAITTGVKWIIVGGVALFALKQDTPEEKDPWGVPVNPEANRASAAHRAANDRSDSGYGGNCTPDEYDKLHEAYKNECAKANELGGCTNSNVNLSRSDRLMRMAAFWKCARAREEIMNTCFAGGDLEHRIAAGETWNAANNCAP